MIQCHFLKWHLLREIVSQLASYTNLTRSLVAGADVSLLPHGLDLKLANLVHTENGIFFVDFFGPKELNDNGEWKTYSPKLDTLSPKNLLAVTATREGAFLRLYRFIEKNWALVGGITPMVLRNKLKQMLEDHSLPVQESNFILSEVHGGYPWLDSIYKEQEI